MNSDFVQYVLNIFTTILIGVLFFLLLRIRIKTQMHYAFISLILLLSIWNLGVLAEKWWQNTNGYTNMIFVSISFIGTCFIPVSFFLSGLIFARTKIKLSYKYLLLLVIPVISTIMLWTNEYHHMFFVKYSFISNDVIYGKYFIVHALYSYTSMLLGMYYLVYFSIKNVGLFSRQSILIIIGSLIPLVVNIIFTLKIFVITQFATPLTFSFAVVCYFIAIVKYDFLGVTPIAMQTVVDRISDSFIVIDSNFRIVDYNKTMVDTFGAVVRFKRKEDIFEVISSFKSIDLDIFKNYIEEVSSSKKSVFFEHHFEQENFNKYFTIEITPIISKDCLLGTIILLKDITAHKVYLRTIAEQQKQIIEKERLASLGTLMGGISHNLKTPIMSITGCIIALEDLTKEYDESIGNAMVEDDDHHEISAEMFSNLNELKGHISYISTALTAIKNQVINADNRKKESFTLEEVILNIEFLLKYELQTNLCILNIDNKVRKDYELHGDIGTFVQILNNLISNAIQAYDKVTDVLDNNISSRKIELIIREIESSIVFIIKDYGKGISKEVEDKLFKEMITTKGKDGSGIGLYLSYSKVRVMFNGDMWFETKEGNGTCFYVKIPQYSSQIYG